MLNADLTKTGRQSAAGGRPLRLIVQTAFPSISLATKVPVILDLEILWELIGSQDADRGWSDNGIDSRFRIGENMLRSLTRMPIPTTCDFIPQGSHRLNHYLILHEPAAHLFHRNHGRFHRRTRKKGPRAALQLPRALGGDDDESIGTLVRIVRNGAV